MIIYPTILDKSLAKAVEELEQKQSSANRTWYPVTYHTLSEISEDSKRALAEIPGVITTFRETRERLIQIAIEVRDLLQGLTATVSDLDKSLRKEPITTDRKEPITTDNFDAKVLALIPTFRTRTREDGYDRVKLIGSFPAVQFPELAKFNMKSSRAYHSSYIDNFDGSEAQKEDFRSMHNLLQPLRDDGFHSVIELRSISTKYINVSIFIS